VGNVWDFWVLEGGGGWVINIHKSVQLDACCFWPAADETPVASSLVLPFSHGPVFLSPISGWYGSISGIHFHHLIIDAQPCLVRPPTPWPPAPWPAPWRPWLLVQSVDHKLGNLLWPWQELCVIEKPWVYDCCQTVVYVCLIWKSTMFLDCWL